MATLSQGWKMTSKNRVFKRFEKKTFKNLKSPKFSFLVFLILVTCYTDDI